MTEITFLGIGNVSLLFIFKWSRKPVLKEILPTELLFQRRFGIWGIFKIRERHIKLITASTIAGKPSGTFIDTDKKIIKIQFPEKNEKVKNLELLAFAHKNDISFAEEEGFHGGEITMLNRSKKRLE